MIIDLNKRWMDETAMPCVTKQPDMFFIDTGTATLAHPTKKVQAAWDRAKAVCGTCPVIKECARDNLGEIEGVWGGLDPAQRVELRTRHAHNVRKLEGELKIEYAKFVYDLRHGDKIKSFSEIGRIMGLPYTTCQYLDDWYADWLKQQPAEPVAEVVDLPLPELPDVHFPEGVPSSGADAWIKYGRRVVYGYYLGQTEDDAWYFFKIKLLGFDYSSCWVKAGDVKMCRDMPRNVLERVGNGSRIYGTHLTKGRRKPAQAG